MGNFAVEIGIKINGNDVSVLEEASINEDALQAECSHQPSKYAMWAAAESEASKLSDNAKLRLDVVEAEMSRQCREIMTKTGDKPTDSKVELAVRLTPEWQKARGDLIEAKFKESMLGKAEKAFLQRKDMLQSLVSLKLREMSAPVETGMQRTRLSRGG